jgi:hypothetical protein
MVIENMINIENNAAEVSNVTTLEVFGRIYDEGIATHASVQKVVTCSRKMAILSHKEKNNNNKNLKKTINEKNQA